MLRVSGERGESTASAAAGNLREYPLRIIAAGVILGILFWARIVFITTITAVVIALILEPFVGILTRFRLPRFLASAVVCLVTMTVLWMVAVAAWDQLFGIVKEAPALRDNIAHVVESVSSKVQAIEDEAARVLTPSRKVEKPVVAVPVQPPPRRSARKTAPPVPPVALPPEQIPEVRIHDDRNAVEDYILDRLDKLSRALLMSTFVPLLVYFMLSWRDHIYKSFLRFFEGSSRLTVSQSLQGIAGVARAFVVGNFIIGVLLALTSSALFAFIQLPYPLLAGGLSGLLSLVPYAGMVLAVLPPLLAALATGVPTTTLLLSVGFAVALHLIAMNVLYPTIVGARVHLNPLVVTFSLMFWGFLWDGAGLLLAIPITAGIKAVCDHVPRLRKYGKFLGD
jgi:predicted PurR-regulated permease PerM